MWILFECVSVYMCLLPLIYKIKFQFDMDQSNFIDVCTFGTEIPSRLFLCCRYWLNKNELNHLHSSGKISILHWIDCCCCSKLTLQSHSHFHLFDLSFGRIDRELNCVFFSNCSCSIKGNCGMIEGEWAYRTQTYL